MSATDERLEELDDQTLLENTNKLLAHVGISAKKIISIDELIRVASSMFVAVFETIFRTRLEGIIRNPKDSQDYISNCQVIIDGLSQHLDMDLRHVTGELIFQGNRRALYHLIRIFMRITHIPIDDDENSQDDHKSDSISSHESAFPPEEYEEKIRPRPALTDSLQTPPRDRYRERDRDRQRVKRTGNRGGVVFEDIRLSPPWSPLSLRHSPGPGYGPGHTSSLSSLDHTEEIDELDIGNLRHSLSEYEQYRRVEAARKRRDVHLRIKSYHSLHRNQKNLEVTCAALQRQWTEDVSREKYSALLRRSDADSVLLRKIQKGMLKQLYDSNEAYNQEIKSKIKDIRNDTKLHFESLQNLFDSRVRMMKEKAQEVRSTSELEVSSYKVLTDDLKIAQRIRQQNISNAQQELIQQKRLHSTKMRRDAHQQLLSFISLNESWEDSLRTTDHMPTYHQTPAAAGASRSVSSEKRKRSLIMRPASRRQQKTTSGNSNGNGKRSPYDTPVVSHPKGGGGTGVRRRSKSIGSLRSC